MSQEGFSFLKKAAAMRCGFFLCACWRSLSDSAYPAWWRGGRFTVMIAVMLSASVPAFGAFYSPPPPVCDGRHASLIPGVGAGPVKIGQDIKSVLEVLQAYINFTAGQDPYDVGWGYRNPDIIQPKPSVLIHHNRIVELTFNVDTAEAGKCFTPAGIRLGSLKDAIRDAYGDPPSTFKTYRDDQWVYNALGVIFDFNLAWSSAKQWPPTAVTEIRVFAPRQFCDTLELERQIIFWGFPSGSLSCADYVPPP